jgi:voltage-gated potassium channel
MVEPTRLEHYERRMEWPLATVALVFLAVFTVRVLVQPRRALHDFIVLPALRPLRLLSLAVVVKALQRAVGHNIRGRVIA